MEAGGILSDRRSYRKRTHCCRGHEFTPENVHIEVVRNGDRTYECRRCKQCTKAKGARHWLLRKGKKVTSISCTGLEGIEA